MSKAREEAWKEIDEMLADLTNDKNSVSSLDLRVWVSMMKRCRLSVMAIESLYGLLRSHRDAILDNEEHKTA